MFENPRHTFRNSIIPKTFYWFAVKYVSENCYQLGFPRNVRWFICYYRQIQGSVNLFYYFIMTNLVKSETCYNTFGNLGT
ncbi:unnamed protein product [Acanthoscelides obtectus]|uniref:Uncharacterized protein n=1 Tax=Acanthoscelides obtectus TaxID=200917 RepID=A0A9P0KL93_ACAOB|nr:unnamed protein product [Acanthoscelides obtectus]CAK1661614.1 hypothetical protein AOBTE_LOCUS22719 [Acanthoscelides obtectus]